MDRADDNEGPQDAKTVGLAHVEQQMTEDIDDLKKADPGDRVDGQVQKYAAMGRVEIDEATNSRLKRLIDKRVLTIMVFTYLVQALDKGTMSFTSIMGILDYTHVSNSQVRYKITG
ncbi:2-ketogluconate transporter [Penicillium angulare]|uniref:2-ketogluconate transporter n=1 Tax=Penicillium angulare TaxID=116970 RepID=UPI0025421A83|nr:2-ketogluconate transporter [Penicillium angulare]KAJ5280060.1 2-ketogluconate transporter [Penicillium angulare]